MALLASVAAKNDNFLAFWPLDRGGWMEPALLREGVVDLAAGGDGFAAAASVQVRQLRARLQSLVRYVLSMFILCVFHVIFMCIQCEVHVFFM